MEYLTRIKEINLSTIDESSFKQRYVGCIVLTSDKQILLQSRPPHWRTFPGKIATFGGHVEEKETPSEALIRELREELGAQVKSDELIVLGAIAEEITKYKDLVYLYYWHDKKETITGFYECEAQYFTDVNEALHHPELMDDVRWALIECQNRKLLL